MDAAIPVGATSEALDDFDRRLLIGAAIGIGLVVAVSTPVHFLAPSLLHVPAAGRGGFGQRLGLDLISLTMTALCAAHSVRTFGRTATILFIIGSFVFTGAIENFLVLSGRFHLLPFGTYTFIYGGLLYFVEVPVAICLGWFTIAYSAFFVMHTVFRRINPLWSALLAGVFAMCLDLMEDPVMSSPAVNAWTWLQKPHSTLTLFSVPVYNYPGWLGVIALFELLWVKARGWEQQLGKPVATRRFFLGVPLVAAVYLGVVLGFEFFVRAHLPHVNLGFGGL